MNISQINIFYNNNDVDYAFCELPADLYKKDIEAYKDVEFIAYKHQFIKAKENEAYGFAVINDYAEFVRNNTDDGYILPSYYCYEVYLELEKQEEHLNYFKLAYLFSSRL